MKTTGKTKIVIAALAVVMAAGLISVLAWGQTAQQAWSEGMGLLGKVLSPHQIKLIAGFTRTQMEQERLQIQTPQDEFDALAQQLQLSANQEDQLIALVAANQDQITAAAQPLLQDELAIRAALTSEPPDPAELRADAKILADDIGAACVLGARMAKSARAILTPEQNQVLDQLLQIQEQIGRKQLALMPTQANQAITFWKELGLTPAQVQGMFDLTDAGLKLADKYGKIEQAANEVRLAGILTPAQMRTLKAFEKAHAPEMESKRDEIVARFLTLRGLNLSQAQMDQLTVLAEARKAEIIAVTQTGADRAMILRDLVLAEDSDEAAIRAGAGRLEGIIGDGLVLAAHMIQEARATATPEQYNLVISLVLYGEQEAQNNLSLFPARFADLTALLNQLNLSPDQRIALRKLHDQQRQRMQKEMEAFTPGG